MKKGIIFLIIALTSLQSIAQDKAYAKKVVQDLCTEEMAGRGYIDNGVNKAADYIAEEFRKMKMKKFKGSYFQNFSFPINTFPTPIICALDNKVLVSGRDFLMVPNSGPCNGTYTLAHFDLKDSLDKILYNKKNRQRLRQRGSRRTGSPNTHF